MAQTTKPVPGHPHLRYEGAATAPAQEKLSKVLLDRLEALARATGLTFDIFSGYRSDAYSKAHGGFAGDPHTRHIAADIDVNGKPIGQLIDPATFARYGLRTGNVANFYHGAPDPSHVDLVGFQNLPLPTYSTQLENHPVAQGRPSPNWHYNFTDLENLWVAAGGARAVAPLMAAIAYAESGGNPKAVNSSSGATGLWQIHPGGSQYQDPWTNAKTAVQKYNTQGLGAWSAYTNGSYKQYLGGKGGSSKGGGFFTSVVHAAGGVASYAEGILIGSGAHGDIGNPIGAAAAVSGFHPVSSVNDAIKWFSGGGFKRVGMILLGAVMLLLGLYLLAKTEGAL